jgi:hypothetical protein
MLFDRAGDGRFAASSISSKGGWGAVTMARLISGPSSELITANPDDGTITIFFPALNEEPPARLPAADRR